MERQLNIAIIDDDFRTVEIIRQKLISLFEEEYKLTPPYPCSKHS